MNDYALNLLLEGLLTCFAVLGFVVFLVLIVEIIKPKGRGVYQPKTSVNRDKPPKTQPRPQGKPFYLDKEITDVKLLVLELKNDIANLKSLLKDEKGHGT